MSQLGLTAPPPFIISKDVCSVEERWKKWKSNFCYYIAATGIESEEQKKAILLYVAGPEVRKVFEQMSIPNDSYDCVMKALDTRFCSMVRSITSPLGLTAPSPFLIPEDVYAVVESWKEWKSIFCCYITATGIESDRQMKAILLHVAGKEVQEVFESMGIPDVGYDEVMEALDTRFCTMELELKDKIKYAAQKKRNLLFPPQTTFMTSFCGQLKILGVEYDLKKNFDWGTPDVYVKGYGPVQIISRLVDNKQKGRAQAKRYANSTPRKCALITLRDQSEFADIEFFYHDNDILKKEYFVMECIDDS